VEPIVRPSTGLKSTDTVTCFYRCYKPPPIGDALCSKLHEPAPQTVAVSNNGYRLALVNEVVAEAHKRSVLVSDNLMLEQQLCLVYTAGIDDIGITLLL
jgi:hypothetical protein